MANNSIRPGYFKLLYAGASGQHTHLVPVRGTASELASPSLTEVATKGGGSVSASVAIASYAAAVGSLLGAGASVYGWELYSQLTDEGEPILLGAGSLSGIAVGAVAQVPGVQVSMSFSSSVGAKGKVVMLDTYFAANQTRNTFASPANDGADVLRNYLLSDDCVRVARGGGFPILVRRMVTKLNDAARRNYYNI